MAINQLVHEPQKLIEYSEKFLKMSEFQQKHDHPLMAYDCYITSKTLLYWGKIILEAKNK